MKERLKEILKCRENSEIPSKLLKALLDSNLRERILLSIDEMRGEKNIDVFRDVFQEEYANRKELKQDYTPDELADLVAGFSGDTEALADVCSGTGSLVVAFLNRHPEVKFVRCEEFSAQPIPFLLLNLALRNVDGEVVHGDSLAQKVFKVYKLKRSEKFSEIEVAGTSNSEIHFDTVISNPPYSLKWEPINDDRFKEYGLAPASKADFAFVLHALSLLKPDGALFEILPHGVLFRGAKEGKIRERLLKSGAITSVIGLPNKLFFNTSIPVAVLTFKKKRKKNDVLFIDASKEFEEGKKQNILKQENIERIIEAYNNRKNVDKFAYLSTLNEIKENDFNLNIPRYVNTYEPEPPVDLEQVLKEWLEINEEISVVENDVLKMFSELVPTDETKSEKMDREKEMLKTIVHTTKTKGRSAEKVQLTLF